MTTPTTPYALFRYVPLSECRQLWWAWVGYGKPPEGWHGNDIERWRNVLAHRCLRRALAAVTAERDAWQKSAEELVEEAEYLKRVRRESDAFAIRYAAERDKLRAERDQLRRDLDAMTGEL